jgi:hypothetical protein
LAPVEDTIWRVYVRKVESVRDQLFRIVEETMDHDHQRIHPFDFADALLSAASYVFIKAPLDDDPRFVPFERGIRLVISNAYAELGKLNAEANKVK